MKTFSFGYGFAMCAAVGLHATILFARWPFLHSDAAYAVGSGDAVELSLVEAAPAPPAAEVALPEPPQPEIEAQPPEPEPEAISEALPPSPELSPEPPPAAPPKPVSRPPTKKTAPPSASQSTRKQTTSTAAPCPGCATGSGVSQPAYLYNPHPAYPAESKQKREQGVVMLDVSINAGGNVSGVAIKQSSGSPRLDRAARDAVARWRFRPARVAGLPVATKTEVPVRFHLD